MSLIEGGKISEGAWFKLTNFLLVVCIGLGTFFAVRALDKLDKVVEAVITHEAEIKAMQREIQALQARGDRTELLPSDFGGVGRLHFRGRAGGPKSDVPRPPSGTPDKAEPPDKPSPPDKPAPDAPKKPRDGRVWEVKS